MPAGEPFISKGTVEYSSNCELLLKIYHFLSFWKSLSSTKLNYIQTLSAIYALTLVFNADVSENTLSFVSQSIKNFSDYDISQSHDWECPSLSPHVLLSHSITLMLHLHATHCLISILATPIHSRGVSDFLTAVSFVDIILLIFVQRWSTPPGAKKQGPGQRSKTWISHRKT